MTRRRYLRAADVAPWLTLAGAILAAGIWLGTLQTRITELEQRERYEHGSYALPKE